MRIERVQRIENVSISITSIEYHLEQPITISDRNIAYYNRRKRQTLEVENTRDFNGELYKVETSCRSSES
jgi:hypothetical protein